MTVAHGPLPYAVVLSYPGQPGGVHRATVNGANTVRLGGQAVRILTDAGFPLDRAGWVVYSALYYVLGHTIEEQAQQAAGDWGDRNPYLPGTDLQRAMGGAVQADPEERFDYGLQLFLDGVRLRLAAARQRTHPEVPHAHDLAGQRDQEDPAAR